VFKTATGMTLSHYRQRSRLVAAIRRIASGDGTFASIATETGFAAHAHLTRSLAQATGSSPKALRARFREI
jgi:transcriptional regulator GlxA family with amidase domain